MREEERMLLKELRTLDSGKATNLLLEKHPDFVNPKVVMGRSWKVSDQFRLGEAYLDRLPHASGEMYKAFASFMSLSNLLKLLSSKLPVSRDKQDLLNYYLNPVLIAKSQSEEDKILVRRIFKALK